MTKLGCSVRKFMQDYVSKFRSNAIRMMDRVAENDDKRKEKKQEKK